MGFAHLEVEDFFFDGAGGDEFVGVDGSRLTDAVGAVDGLGFDGGVPPGVVKDDVAGGGEVESGAGGAEAQQENAGIRVGLEGVDDVLTVFGFAGEEVGGHLAGFALGFEKLEHLHELAEDEDFLAFGEQRFEEFEKGIGLAGSGVAAEGWDDSRSGAGE